MAFQDDVSAALGSTFSALGPEMVGLEPPASVRQFREQYPWLGLGTQVAGFSIPYIGWGRAVTAIPAMSKAVAQIGARASSPVASVGLQEIAKFVPFEAGRIAATGIVGGDMGQSLTQAGLSLGLGGLAGSGFKAAELALARRAAKPALGVAQDIGKPLQQRLESLTEQIAAGTAPDLELLRTEAAGLRKEIYRQRASKRERYFGELEDAADPEAVKFLNKLMVPGIGPQSKYLTQMFDQGGAVHQMPETVFDRKIAEFGLAGNEHIVKYPRRVTAASAVEDKAIQGLVLRSMTPSTDGWYWARDARDGLFSLARRGDEGDWAFFKTSNPGMWMKSGEAWRKKLAERNAGVFGSGPQLGPPTGAPQAVVYDTAMTMKQLPNIDYTQLPQGKSILAHTLDKIGVSGIKDINVIQDTKALLRNVMLPTAHVFAHSPAAKRVFQGGVAAKSAAEGFAERLFVGARPREAKTPFAAIFRESSAEPLPTSIAGIVNAMSKGEVEAFQRALFADVRNPELAVQRYGMSPRGLDLHRALKDAYQQSADGVRLTGQGVGRKIWAPEEHHMKAWLSWGPGDWRVKIMGPEGKTVGVVAHRFEKAAVDLAKQVIAKAQDKDWYLGPKFAAGSMATDISVLRQIDEVAAQDFGRVMNSVRGPLHKNDLRQRMFDWFRGQQLHNAEVATKEIFRDERALVGHTDPRTAQALDQKLDTMWGRQGPSDKFFNKAMDAALGSVLGKNSASKIVQGINKSLWHLTFGMGHMAFNLANLFTTVQTGLPHLMYLTKAKPARVMQWYSMFPVDGVPGASEVGMLNIMKLMGQSIKDMARPDEDLMQAFRRAQEEAVVAPRFVEEWVGQNSVTAARLRDAVRGEEPVSGLIGSLSSWIPAQVEKFTRGHAFVLGHRFFKDIAQVKDPERLYQLSKQFVEHTQYLYGVEHRPSAITGPMGATLGLFKNWMFNYVAWMGEYAGEAFLRGNKSPLLWMAAGTQLLGGAGGLGPISLAAGAANKAFSDESLMKNTYDMLGEFADPVYFGLPTMLGVSLQNQVAMPFSDPVREASMFWDIMLLDRAKYLGDAISKGIAHTQLTGENPLADPRARDMLAKALAPRHLYMAMQAFSDSALHSAQTGYPVKKLTPLERGLYAAGMQPVDLAKYYKVQEELWRSNEKRRAAIAKYGTEYAEAMAAQNTEEMMAVKREAVLSGVPLDSVLKSARTRVAKGQEQSIESRFPARKVDEYRQAGLLQ